LADRMAVIGTGLIGGSIALGVRATDPHVAVVGFDAAPGVVERARARDAVTDVAGSPAEAAAGANLIVLAVPVDQMPAICDVLKNAVEPGAVVTDVGSAKGRAVAAGEAACGGRFVGGHPMAGSELHGIEAADGRLFEGAPWILTPTETTSSHAYSRVAEMVGGLGAKPVALDPAAHDALLARLSHVPQLVASALVGLATASGEGDALLSLAAGGFRDVTRIAASNPDLWVAVLHSNRAAVLQGLQGLGAELDAVAAMLEGSRWDDLREWLNDARTARIEVFAKPDYGGEPVALTMLIPDRPGVLAEVTTAAGQLGANLEDIEIFHSTEGGSGRLELVVAGRDPAEKLARALTDLGYVVERGVIE
jgi:prephenate dehydrogenase